MQADGDHSSLPLEAIFNIAAGDESKGEKVGAAGFEPANLTDVNPRNWDPVRNVPLLEVETLNNKRLCQEP